MNVLKGYRTYIVAAATILGGVVLLIDGKYVEGFAAISAGIGLLTARDAVRRLEQSL